MNKVKNDLVVVAAEAKNVAMGDSETAITTAAKTRAAEEGSPGLRRSLSSSRSSEEQCRLIAESFSAAVTAMTDTANAVEATRTEGRTAAGQQQ